jgi:two-component system phosphate regulon sensor histidine kinase PhoR
MLSVNLVKMSDGDGSAGGILVTLQDVTQERALERMKSEFISNVSHELRTPMTSIKNAINIVLDRTAGELNANQEKFLAIAMRNIDRLARLINDVLDFSKLESGAANLKIQPVDLAKLIDNVFISTQAHAQQKRIALNKKLAPALPKISADSDKVEQVLVNLLNNALKFTPEGGQITIAAESGKVPSGRPPAYRSGRIEARERGEAGHEGVRVSVIDTGVGIAPEHIDSIFDRFKQIEHSRTTKTEGTGLGLSICKKIVELHGGMIGVESAPAAGSKFWFTLPVEGKSHAQNSDR